MNEYRSESWLIESPVANDLFGTPIRRMDDTIGLRVPMDVVLAFVPLIVQASGPSRYSWQEATHDL